MSLLRVIAVAEVMVGVFSTTKWTNDTKAVGGFPFVLFACFAVADRCCFASGRVRPVRCHVGKCV
ncbi:hypothetical protein FHS27_000072 [Rhodopirellula rubra]|uniref:Uncharacterized protein n=1 Tax=Aporhodopirellula rubra TaxID=980271 RepID=A0A7W5H3P5_9BACT|nr:hypothetical protein [Aporhodopirellula rubra]